MPRIKYYKYLILGICITILLIAELTAKPAMKSGFQRTCTNKNYDRSRIHVLKKAYSTLQNAVNRYQGTVEFYLNSDSELS